MRFAPSQDGSTTIKCLTRFSSATAWTSKPVAVSSPLFRGNSMLELLHFMIASLHSMFGLLLRAWMVFVGWFQPDVPHGVFWGSMLVTFVGSVMGDDQAKRLKSGAFGAAAGTSLGALA